MTYLYKISFIATQSQEISVANNVHLATNVDATTALSSIPAASSNVLSAWSSVCYDVDTKMFQFFDVNNGAISYSADDFRQFIDNNLFSVDGGLSKNSMKKVKDAKGRRVLKNGVARIKGGATRSQCQKEGISVTTLLEVNNGAKSRSQKALSQPYVELQGEGYCMLMAAYHLHPTMTAAQVEKFAEHHTLDESWGNGFGVYVILPNTLINLIHDYCTDSYFKSVLDPVKTRNKNKSNRITEKIKECDVEKGKLLLELKDVRHEAVVDIRHFVAYDASRNIVIEPSQRRGIEIIRNIDNYPMILDTLGYSKSYEIVGIYKLVTKPPMRRKSNDA